MSVCQGAREREQAFHFFNPLCSVCENTADRVNPVSLQRLQFVRTKVSEQLYIVIKPSNS